MPAFAMRRMSEERVLIFNIRGKALSGARGAKQRRSNQNRQIMAARFASHRGDGKARILFRECVGKEETHFILRTPLLHAKK